MTTGLQFAGASASSTAQQVRLVQLVLDASKVRNANAAAAVVANSGAINGEICMKTFYNDSPEMLDRFHVKHTGVMLFRL